MLFKKGLHSGLNTEFKKGYISWNKGTAKITKKNCQWCKKEFNNPFWRNYTFCSRKCVNEFKKLPKILKNCKLCNKEFYVSSYYKDRKLFCSFECFGKSLKGKKLSEKIRKNISIAHIGQIPWNKGKVGVQVSQKKGKKFPQFSGENSPHWKSKIKKVCQQCNKSFEVKPSLQRIKFCSNKCAGLSKRGENHPQWKNGGIQPLYETVRRLVEYKEWRKRIFQRDNYTCQECFNRGGKLHSHHNKKSFAIIFQEFLYQYNQFSPIEDKETLVRLAITYEPFWDINNGQTLCEECHKETKNYLVGR